MKRNILVAVSLTACVLVSLVAQTTPAAPKPGAEHKRMDYFLGTWNRESQVKASVFGPAGKNTGKETVEALPGGFFIVFRWDAQTTMGPNKGTGVMGYNQVTKAYTFNGYDSAGWHGIGKGALQGKTWTWSTEDYFGDKLIKGRYTATETSPGAYTFKYEMQGDNGAWTKIDEGKATKIK